jgi:cell division protein FtsB
MPSNRRRHANVLPVASLATWIVLAAFVCGGGLYYVYCKNELHARGTQIKALEKEFADLVNQNEVVRANIARLASPNELRKRREKDRTFLADMVEIQHDRLVLVSDKVTPVAPASELRAVANTKP